MLNAVLRVVGGKQDGKVIPLSTRKFLIGREQDCHLRPGSESVSRHHCAISIDDFTVRVRDLGSSNGTFINGTRVLGVHDAQPGDRLKIGTLEFDILFSQSEVPAGVAAEPAEDRGGTAFSLDEFALPEAGLSETAIMGGDTAIMPKPGNIPEAEPTPEAGPVSESDAIPEPDLSPAPQTVAELPAAVSPQQPVGPGQYPPGQYPPGAMPGMQPPGYPYGMPQPMMPQPGYGMPGMMPQPGYPYGMPQPGYPYGMPQPGYGMPGMMPQYGMPYPQYPQAAGYPGMAPGYAPQPMEAPEEEVEEEGTAATTELPVVLPDPATTGFKEAPKPADGAAPAPPKPNPAADILKKMQSRR